MNENKFPTEVIDLPSQGKVYSKDNPLSKGSIEIKYMTAREEDILASQNLIKKGVVIDKLFESVIVDKTINIDDIIIGDKNAILLATRMLGYGNIYKAEVTDPFTLEKQGVDIDLAAVKIKEIDTKILNSENRYKFKLPKSELEVVFKLLTHGDELNIAQEIKALEKLSVGKDASKQEVTTRLRYMILEVDGKTDRGFINDWVRNSLLSIDSRALRDYVLTISPGLDFKFKFVSDITGEEEALDIPFGISFFYPSN
jgi:hypothetical protein